MVLVMGWKIWDEAFGDGLGYLRCGLGGLVRDEGFGRWDGLVEMGA